LIARHEKEIVVNGEQTDESEKKRGGGEKMPHVVVIEEIHPVARLVHVPKQDKVFKMLMLLNKSPLENVRDCV